MKIFLYDDLMRDMEFEKITGTTAQEKYPAFVRGELIDSERMSPRYLNNKLKSRYPIMLEKETRRSPCTVFGAIIEVPSDPAIMNRLDAYYNCSKFHLGTNKKTDMFHRKQIDVNVIWFNSIEQFLEYRYEVTGHDQAWVYVGNKAHPAINRKLSDLSHNRIGNLWKSFFNVF